MDKLLAETKVKENFDETEIETQKEEQVSESVVENKNDQDSPPQNSYISSFENVTIADVKKESAKENLQKEFEGLSAREKLFPQRYQKEVVEEENQTSCLTKEKDLPESETSSGNSIIEKPNYDLLETNKKIIKLKNNVAPKKKRNKKLVGLALACALGGTSIICVTNCVILDQMNSSFLQIEDSYKLNLAKYLRDIYNLDATKNSMEMLETYPDKMLDAGDLGQKSNWFDRLCNFIGGIFGG